MLLAHVIRNMSTKQFRALNRIPTYIRWCLSGTPIQNTLADLGALVAFLGVPILKEPATFRKYIDDSSHSLKVNSQSDFKNLRLLLGSICLRRSKTILPLFGLKMEERRPEFSTQEREEYRQLELKCRRAIDLAVSGHNTKETHQSVIEALLRLRLFCNNGSTEESDKPSSFSRDTDEALSMLQQSGEAVCKYCSCDVLSMGGSDGPELVHLTKCCRLVCGECRIQYQHDLKNAQASGKNSCPFCSDEHGVNNLLPKEMGDRTTTTAARKVYPSKLMALLEDVQRNPLQEKRYVLLLYPFLEPTNSQYSIVFSFWKKSLDLVGELFKANGVQYCHVDGSLSLGKRKTVLLEFQENQEVGILIMTLGTGAVG
jgi:SWI/SNF-related matrix-associated actin-dependent regulator of chromatin subfamily A3